MARLSLTVVNPGAEVALGGEWVNAANTLTRGSGGFQRSGGFGLAVQNSGAYEHYQDVAIPPAEYAAVDASQRAVEYEGYGIGLNTGTHTILMYLKALDGGGGVLQTWSEVITARGTAFNKPYQEFSVRLEAVPSLTRTLRIGWSGTQSLAGAVWTDDHVLALDDVALMNFKFNGYAVGAQPATDLVSAKFLAYAHTGPGVALDATKFIAYGVVTTPDPVIGPRTRVRLVHLPMVVS